MRSGLRRRRLLPIIFVVVVAGAAIMAVFYGAMPVGRRPLPESLTSNRTNAAIYARIDPLDGRRLSELDSPQYLGVVVENSPAARPQRGLAAASIVYEMLAEGGITRFLAFYSSPGPVAVGPIRSVRPYIIDIAAQHGAVLVHCGGSVEALQMINRLNYPSINEMSNGSVFYRDEARRAPHNLYALADSLMDRAQRMGYRTDYAESGLEFRERELLGGNDRTDLEIAYSKGYSVEWRYDSNSNSYVRSMGQKAHTDLNTGCQISAKNIIVQVVDTQVLDDEGRLSMKLAGSGGALALIGGRVVRGRWIRSSASSDPTLFVSEGGSPVKLNPGKTWIQIVPEGTAVEVRVGRQ